MGIFDRLKKKKETEPAIAPKPDTMGAVLFDRTGMDMQCIEDRVCQMFGENVRIDADYSHPSVANLNVRLDGLEFWCSYMPFPLPAEEMDIAYTVQFNALRPEEKQAFCEHKSFMLIAQKGGGTSLENKRRVCWLFSQLCGAWMALDSAVGFCLNTTGLLVSRNDYLRHVEIMNEKTGQDPDYFPAPLWIWVLHQQEGDSPTIESWGLKEFGISELMFYNPKSDYADVCGRIYVMSALQITGKAYYQNMDMITFENGETAIFKKNGEKLAVIGG